MVVLEEKLPKQKGMNTTKIEITMAHINGKNTKNKRFFRSSIYESDENREVKRQPLKGKEY